MIGGGLALQQGRLQVLSIAVHPYVLAPGGWTRLECGVVALYEVLEAEVHNHTRSHSIFNHGGPGIPNEITHHHAYIIRWDAEHVDPYGACVCSGISTYELERRAAASAQATFDVTPPSLESLSSRTCLLLNLCALGMSRGDVASHMRELRYAK